ncbi:hypothetical protein BG004_001079 [Podila humilis]|nr:hypothetical protein BG004_001079 [Podila humilis]
MSMHPEQLELEDAFELHRPMAGVSTTATTTAAATLAAEPSSTLSLEHKEPQTLLSIVAGPFNSPHLQGKESMDDAIARHRTNSTASQPQLTQASALKNKKICRARSLPIIWSNSAEHGINLTMEEEAYLEKELYGLSAKAEEDLALQYGLELAAKRKHSIQRTQCTQQSGGGVGDGLSSGRDLEENGDEHNNGNEIEGTEAEKDNGCLSGICQPSSKFFRTSVICSNTMARDGLGNDIRSCEEAATRALPTLLTIF